MALKHKKVLVTGASGFLAGNVIKQLLDRGHIVKGTFRSQAKADKVSAAFKGLPFETAIVSDIGTAGAFDHVFKEDKAITAVVHTASPVTIGDPDAIKNLVTPAVEGVKNILQAITKYAPQVTRVVYTTSVVAVFDFDRLQDHSAIFDETSWNKVTKEDVIKDHTLGYRASKALAEKEFWRFIKEEKPNFTGVSIAPPYIFGPSVPPFKSFDEVNFTNKVLYDQAFGTQDESTDFTSSISPFVDVRDVAAAHALATEQDNVSGERLLVIGGQSSAQVLLDVLHKNFPELKGKIPVGKPGTGLALVPHIFQYNNDKTNKLLNIKYTKFEDTATDIFKNLLALPRPTQGLNLPKLG